MVLACEQGAADNRRKIREGIDDPEHAAKDVRAETGPFERVGLHDSNARKELSRAPAGDARQDHRRDEHPGEPDQGDDRSLVLGADVHGRAGLDAQVVAEFVDHLALEFSSQRISKLRIGERRQGKRKDQRHPDQPIDQKGADATPDDRRGFDNKGLDGGDGMVCTLPSVAHGGGRAGSLSLHERDRFPDPELFDKIVNLSKRRGFVFQSAEIYGGFRSTYDYGPLGVLFFAT